MSSNPPREFVSEVVENDDDVCRKLPEISDARVTKIVQYLLEGRDYSEIAAALNVSVRWVWDQRRRYNLDEYMARINADAMQAAANGYIALAKGTVQELRKMLKSHDKDDRKWAVEQFSRMQARRDRLAELAGGDGDGPPPPPPDQPARRLSNAELTERARVLAFRREQQRRR